MSNKQAFPANLLSGYENFRANRLTQDRERYAQLAAEGQKPHTMVIACCDSRSTPEAIFDCGPGEIFVVRNVANLVAPYKSGEDYHGTASALEFAIQALKVKNIVVMGHAKCGGIDAFRRQMMGETLSPLSEGNFIGKWIAQLEPVAQEFERIAGETDQELQGRLEKHSIFQSVEHLKTFPYIADLMERGEIALHGAWFDISNGELWTMDPETGAFEKPAD